MPRYKHNYSCSYCTTIKGFNRVGDHRLMVLSTVTSGSLKPAWTGSCDACPGEAIITSCLTSPLYYPPTKDPYVAFNSPYISLDSEERGSICGW